MPRTKLGEEEYAKKDFLRHLEAQRHYHGYHTQRELGEVLGCCQGTVGAYLQDPGKIQTKTLRKMVKRIRLDPVVVLRYLGYTAEDIKKLREGRPWQ